MRRETTRSLYTMGPSPSQWHLHKCWSLCYSQQHIRSRRTAVSGCVDFCEGSQRVAMVYSEDLTFYIQDQWLAVLLNSPKPLIKFSLRLFHIHRLWTRLEPQCRGLCIKRKTQIKNTMFQTRESFTECPVAQRMVCSSRLGDQNTIGGSKYLKLVSHTSDSSRKKVGKINICSDYTQNNMEMRGLMYLRNTCPLQRYSYLAFPGSYYSLKCPINR